MVEGDIVSLISFEWSNELLDHGVLVFELVLPLNEIRIGKSIEPLAFGMLKQT